MSPRKVVATITALFVVAILCGCSDASVNGSSQTGWIDAGGPSGDATASADSDSDVSPNPDATGDAPSGVDAGPAEGVVPTEQGPVRGEDEVGVWSFLGIPYAAPPVGELRWRAPIPPAPRQGLLAADRFAPACPQPNTNAGLGEQDEDCLYLNIWTPEPRAGADLPVMVFIHGGGFVSGSARQTASADTGLYEGSNLARKDAVVVTLDYRLGALGFAAHQAFIGESPLAGEVAHPTAGNYGLLDQLRALQWVRANVDAFGGDADNVTVFGESSGAASICVLMTSPLADGLFERALMESGYCPGNLRQLDERGVRLEAATEQGARLAEALGCDQGDDVAACMREKPASEVVDALDVAPDSDEQPEGFAPVVDGYVVDSQPLADFQQGLQMDVPLLIGVNRDEGTYFAWNERNMTAEQYSVRLQEIFPTLYRPIERTYPADDFLEPWLALAAVWGDAVIICPSRRLARQHRAAGNPVFTYYFTHVTEQARRNNLGAYHTAELPFVFGSFGPLGGRGEESELSDKIQRWWTQFAADGRPGTVAEVTWPLYQSDADEGIELDADGVERRSGFRQEYCDWWDSWR